MDYSRKAFGWMMSVIIVVLALVVPHAQAVAVKDVENVHVADRTRYVTDMAGVLSAAGRARADSILGDIWAQTGAEPVVVIIDSTDGEDIDEYATELFSLWGIGKKDRDNGVLVLIAVGDRKNVIRTGYGVEPVLPDVVCWSISTNRMNPKFKEGDFDGGVIAGLEAMRGAMTSDEAREELRSEMANDGGASREEVDLFKLYLGAGVACAVAMLLLVLYLFVSTRGKTTVEAYEAWDRWKLPAILVTVLFIGIPLPALIIMLLKMRHVRLHKHPCPNCGTLMRRLDEQKDNEYLTPSQDLEEHLKSVDYDVWLCPNCNEKDIIPYVNPHTNYRICPACGTRAERLVGERIVQQPTELSNGVAVKDYECANCRNRRMEKTLLPKLPPIIIAGGGFGRGGGGGGFSGGSFGGGMTGGGGSSTSW